jgi:hypothetical protein
LQRYYQRRVLEEDPRTPQRDRFLLKVVCGRNCRHCCPPAGSYACRCVEEVVPSDVHGHNLNGDIRRAVGVHVSGRGRMHINSHRMRRQSMQGNASLGPEKRSSRFQLWVYTYSLAHNSFRVYPLMKNSKVAQRRQGATGLAFQGWVLSGPASKPPILRACDCTASPRGTQKADPSPQLAQQGGRLLLQACQGRRSLQAAAGPTGKPQSPRARTPRWEPRGERRGRAGAEFVERTLARSGVEAAHVHLALLPSPLLR